MVKILVTGGAGFIGSHVSVNNIFRTLIKVTAYPVPVQCGAAKAGEMRHIDLVATKSIKDLGWSPTLTLEEGWKKTVTYFWEAEAA